MLTEEKLQDLAAKHGGARGLNGIKHVEYNGIDLVFRRPLRHEAQAYIRQINADGGDVSATEQLAQLLVVLCGGAEGAAAKPAFLALLDDYPFLVRSNQIAVALARLTGAVQDDAVKPSGTPSSGNVTSPTTTPKG